MRKVIRKQPLSLAEQIRSVLRASSGLRGVLPLGMSAALLSTPSVHAVELPQPCVSGGCGVNGSTNSPVTWLSSGTASASISGNTLTVNQSTESVALNWASFNISADGKVIFSQPSTSSIALNRIFQQSPSQVMGSVTTQLNSDPTKTGGQVYLINPNGFVFGKGSSVNAAGILVSTLSMSNDVSKSGLLSAIQSGSNGNPALAIDLNALAVDSEGKPIKGQIVINAGAEMKTTALNGRVLLASSNVTNGGHLVANDGQIVIAAGDKVYLSASRDESLRGLLVEVDGDAIATNNAVNQSTGVLEAARGDITMIGLAVNQQGRISASTSVSANGSVHLLARDSVVRQQDRDLNFYWSTQHTGKVTLGSGSSIQVNPQNDDQTTAVDAQKQLLSNIEIFGKQIILDSGANITAHGGNLKMTAVADPSNLTAVDSDVRLHINSGATIDLSGSTSMRSVADNIVTVELRGSELADSPEQRNGALRGKTVVVDARVGTDIADVSGAIAGIGKTVAQRTSEGGSAVFVSTGDIVTANNAHIDVSGGQTIFDGAMVNTSQLITADGKTIDIGSAKKDVTYTGVVSPTTAVKHDRWGVIESVGQQTGSHYEAGYLQGSSAGVIKFDAPALLLNATMTGRAVNGAHQRMYSATGNYDYALGGSLVIGNVSNETDYRAPAVILTAHAPNIVVSDDANLSNIPLTLSTDFLHAGGFTRTEINSNETVTIADDAAMNLLPGSAFSIRASQININSNISTPSGKIDINSLNTVNHINGGGIHVSDAVSLNVDGQWINDLEIENPQLPINTLLHNAGSISLNTVNIGGALYIGSGVKFSADAGAWLKSTDIIVGGEGGKISLLSNGSHSSFSLGDDVMLSAFGVNGMAGGEVSIAAGRMQISSGKSVDAALNSFSYFATQPILTSDGQPQFSVLPRSGSLANGLASTWANAQLYDQNNTQAASYFMITPQLFSQYGFSKFNIIATGATLANDGVALQVSPNTYIDAVAKTLLIDRSAQTHSSGSDVHGFTDITTLLPFQRTTPAKINLTVKPNAVDDALLSARVGTLNIGDNARISGDTGTIVNLVSSNGSIDIDGALIAKSGQVSARIVAPSNAQQTPNDIDLAINLGSHAFVDVGAVFIDKPNDLGLAQGSLKDAGTITFTADRGSVKIKSGAVIDASGTQAALDIPSSDQNKPYQRAVVASNAGAISMAAAESIINEGTLRAHAGQGESGIASGGSLSIALTRNEARAENSSFPESFSTNARVVRLSTGVLPSQSTIDGITAVSVDGIAAAGFDNVTLAADDTVHIDAGVTLSLRQRLVFDAPMFEVGDGAIDLQAGYVSFGSAVLPTNFAASNGKGAINMRADNIDISGFTAWRNVGVANLVSNGDIRLSSSPLDNEARGQLLSAAKINFAAARMYATTGSQFLIDDTGYELTLSRTSVSSSVPLTAASSITIAADGIHQNGTILAPFGSITLNANTLTLGAGSVTSVSGNGAVIPYGTTDGNGRNWLYNNSAIQSLPGRTILLKGVNDVAIDASATVDLSGGGNLYAYEWIKGTSGSNDAFAFKLDSNGNPTNTLTNSGLFAIIPSLGMQLAPIDNANTRIGNAQGLKVGDSVYLAGTRDLAAGYYTLLPASYSLLPDTYLIRAVPGLVNISPNTSAVLADGTPVVAGYKSFGNTGLGGANFSGYAIYPGTWGRSLAEYHDSYASTYFKDTPIKTVDAGQLGLSTEDKLSVNGKILAAAQAGGQAATIDIAAKKLQITSFAAPASDGVVRLQDSILNSWHAGRLLLGGLHQHDGTEINVIADEVSVTPNAHLLADEVILTAKDKVSIYAGGSVKSTSATNSNAAASVDTAQITLTGAGADKAAFVAVSDVGALKVKRDDASGSAARGEIDLSAGSMVASHGALNIDAPGGGTLDTTIEGENAEWTIASSHLALNDYASDGALTIKSYLFDNLQKASKVNLVSSGAIDFNHYINGSMSLGKVDAPLHAISLQAASLNNVAGEDVSLFAKKIDMTGQAATLNLFAATTLKGKFSANASNIELHGSAMIVDGFQNVAWLSSQLFKVSDHATVSTAGDLQVSATRITAGGASEGALLSSGNVTLSSLAEASSMLSLELGGGLRIEGTNISDDAYVAMPSGSFSLKAKETLTLGDHANIDVAGVPVYVAGVRVDSNGGAIHLNAGGDINAKTGSQLSVAASADSDAGDLYIHSGGVLALSSALHGAAIEGRGGSIGISSQQIGQFAELNDALQQGGFTQKQSIHVDHGDLWLATGKTVTAHDVEWITDSGHLAIDGVMNAPSSDERSSIRMYAADGIVVRGELHADGNIADGRGGDIEVGISADAINHANANIDLSKAVITARGRELGDLRLRASILNNDVSISALPANLSQLNQVLIEAVTVSPTITNVNWTSVKNTAINSYKALSSNAALQSRLFMDSKVLLSPGVELTNSGDINLGSVDLYSWNINGRKTPIALSIRAGGSINVNGVISDGFASTGTGAKKYITAANTPSATLRLVAGSNLNSVDPLSINSAFNFSSSGNLVFASNSIVRTGMGDVSLAAAHDVEFKAGSSVYTGGVNTPDQAQILLGTTGASASFLINGGQLSIDAGHDVKGSTLTQSVTAWQPRATCTTATACATAKINWGIDLRQFQWNVGSLGGGDLRIVADHDVDRLSAANAESGIVSADRLTTNYYGGGALRIQAANNINSGMLYVGRGAASITAENAVTTADWKGAFNSVNAPGLFVAMGDATLDIKARSGITLDRIVNPTMLEPPAASGRRFYFFTYGENSGADVRSVSGNINFMQGFADSYLPFFGNSTNDTRMQILPPNLKVAALSGDVISAGRSILLYPSDSGKLSVVAAQDIKSLVINMSDAAEGYTSTSPLASSKGSADIINTQFGSGNTLSARHQADASPVNITAGGYIADSAFDVPKAMVVTAGGDIVDTTIRAQNLNSTDVTEVIAGQDIRYTAQGGIISVGGPGKLNVLAGRHIDLGVSDGVESTGRLNNPNIGDANGAGITLMAGIESGWDVSGFVDNVVIQSNELSNSLLVFMRAVTNNANLTMKDSVEKFKLLKSESQRPFILNSFFSELVASGREATTDAKKGYSRGYAAIDALFPESRTDHSTYDGDISMLFSRVYTLSGGDINMLAPGGKLDVGVAARPQNTTLNKAPGQLGIVAQQAGDIHIFTNDDVSVNSSRIFTLGGGNIAIWSTLGNIDAGKGAKSSLSIPPPATTIDDKGNVTLVLTGAVAGSGIRTIQTNPETNPGDVDLIAPTGFVNAGDAGIGASGNINIAASKVVGADNINFGGQASGVPAATSGVGVALSGASQTGGSSDKAVDKSTDDNSRGNKEDKAPIAQAALSWLEVFVTGLGEESCKQDDIECLKRQN